MTARAALAALAALAAAAPAAAHAREPLAGRQWDMRAIHATPKGSYAVERGSHAVRVGIMDTGVEAGHPDIAANYDRRLSRDFTGARRAGRDPIGHGTHVAGTIGAPLNGFGMAGVAPGVDLVSLRVGDDNGSSRCRRRSPPCTTPPTTGSTW